MISQTTVFMMIMSMILLNFLTQLAVNHTYSTTHYSKVTTQVYTSDSADNVLNYDMYEAIGETWFSVTDLQEAKYDTITNFGTGVEGGESQSNNIEHLVSHKIMMQFI